VSARRNALPPTACYRFASTAYAADLTSTTSATTNFRHRLHRNGAPFYLRRPKSSEVVVVVVVVAAAVAAAVRA